jgi:hypothetical protein
MTTRNTAEDILGFAEQVLGRTGWGATDAEKAAVREIRRSTNVSRYEQAGAALPDDSYVELVREAKAGLEQALAAYRSATANAYHTPGFAPRVDLGARELQDVRRAARWLVYTRLLRLLAKRNAIAVGMAAV